MSSQGLSSRRVARVLFLFVFAFSFFGLAKAQSSNWVWLNGSSSSLQPGVYGTTGVASSQNTPGARFDASNWTDKSGNFWLFGGEAGSSTPGAGYQLDELWKYDRTLRQWIFVKGDVSAFPVAGVYGTKGVSDAANHPGAREGSAAWTDTNGDVWIFGGRGYDSQGQFGFLNDLWKLNSATTQWAWIGGNDKILLGAGEVGTYGTKGTADAANLPGGRMQATAWIDQAGDLWLFGGEGFASSSSAGADYLNDLWRFSVADNQWTWIAGSNQLHQNGTYGVLDASATGNSPGGRQGSRGWPDKNGDFLLFGGIGLDSVGTDSYMNDLWRFSESNNQWTWIGGSNTGPGLAIYGTKGAPSSSNIPGGRVGSAIGINLSGNLMLFGGVGVDSLGHGGYLDDLWEFDITNSEWTWLGASSLTETQGSYGTLGTVNPTNQPGSRTLANLWVDERGTTWLFGGFGLDSGALSNIESPLNDLWAFNPSAAPPTITPDGGTFNGHATASINDSTQSAQIYFTTDGSDPTTSSTVYSSALTITDTENLKAIAVASGYMPSDVTSALFTINQPVFAVTGTNVSVSAGASSGNISQITVTPSNGFTGTVGLTAALSSTPAGAVKLPTLNFGSTSTVTISSATSQTANLTISTVAPTTAALHYPASERWWPVGETALGSLLLLGFGKRMRRYGLIGGLVLMAAITQIVCGCGGGGGGSNPGGGQSSPGTTPGTYTITVTGSSGSLVETTTITLTVK